MKKYKSHLKKKNWLTKNMDKKLVIDLNNFIDNTDDNSSCSCTTCSSMTSLNGLKGNAK